MLDFTKTAKLFWKVAASFRRPAGSVLGVQLLHILIGTRLSPLFRVFVAAILVGVLWHHTMAFSFCSPNNQYAKHLPLCLFDILVFSSVKSLCDIVCSLFGVLITAF